MIFKNCVINFMCKGFLKYLLNIRLTLSGNTLPDKHYIHTIMDRLNLEVLSGMQVWQENAPL